MSENNDELIKAQNELIGVLFEIIKRLQSNNDLDAEYFQIIGNETRSDTDNSRLTEITKEIVKYTKENLKRLTIKSIIKVGNNSHLPFDPSFFDYLLSWNSCYYMGDNLDFNLHVNEYARVLKKNGYLIMAIPKETKYFTTGFFVPKIKRSLPTEIK